MQDAFRDVGRLDGRITSLETQFARFEIKLDRIDAAINQLALAMAETKGSARGTSHIVSLGVSVAALAGAWLAPVLERLFAWTGK